MASMNLTKYTKEQKVDDDIAKDLAKGVSQYVISEKMENFAKLLGIPIKDEIHDLNVHLLKNKEAVSTR